MEKQVTQQEIRKNLGDLAETMASLPTPILLMAAYAKLNGIETELKNSELKNKVNNDFTNTRLCKINASTAGQAKDRIGELLQFVFEIDLPEWGNQTSTAMVN
jgi:hypothetical protein